MMEQKRLAEFDSDDTADDSEDDWTFAGVDTKYMTHGLHAYPARMIPQVARKLILKYSKFGDTVWDPFSGSGSTLVECMLTGRASVGTDLNPFATFLSRVKTTPIDFEILRKAHEILSKKISTTRTESHGSLEIPKMHNVDLWYKKYVQHDLAIIKKAISSIIEDSVRDFFRLCLAHTARETSNLKKREFKVVRMKEEEQKTFKPDVYQVFGDNIRRCIPLMQSFQNALPENYIKSKVIYSDNRTAPINNNSIDLVVTSPPYGDHGTTVAYGQFSRYPAHWISLDHEAVKTVDRRGLGGKSPREFDETALDSDSIRSTYWKVHDNSPKRAKQFFNFFYDYNESIEAMYKKLKSGGHAGIVIGNRLMARVRIPTDKITAELGVALGFKHVTTFPRNIPTKRMPWQNAPENVEGFKADTMHNEHIVILAK
ncbi:MAG: DNA methyltransferase [Candidatus Thorarchaeota archaeon]|nr:DNA methyltransferase [Candidatus Thorarchaeota archaeon]